MIDELDRMDSFFGKFKIEGSTPMRMNEDGEWKELIRGDYQLLFVWTMETLKVSQLILAMDFEACYGSRYKSFLYPGYKQMERSVPVHYAELYKWAAAMKEPYGGSFAGHKNLRLQKFNTSWINGMDKKPTAFRILN